MILQKNIALRSIELDNLFNIDKQINYSFICRRADTNIDISEDYVYNIL